MAIKYNNSNNLREITFGEDDVKYVKFKSGSSEEIYVWAKPFTLTFNNLDWSKVEKIHYERTTYEPSASKSGDITSGSTLEVYYGDVITITEYAKSGFCIETQPTISKTFDAIIISENTTLNLTDPIKCKYKVFISGLSNSNSSHTGHIGSVYLSTNKNATSGSASGTSYNVGSEVWGFVKLRDDGASNIPSGWTLVSGTGGKKDAIYRIGSKIIDYKTVANIDANGYDFGTQSLATYKYTLKFSNSGYTSWDDNSNITEIYWGDKISKSGQTLTISNGDYNTSFSEARTYSFLYDEPTKYYYYNETFSPASIPSSITSDITFTVSNERKVKRITINVSNVDTYKFQINLTNSVNMQTSKTIDAGTTFYLYFLYNYNYYNTNPSSFTVNLNGTNHTFSNYSSTTYNSRSWKVYRKTFSNFTLSSNNVETESITYNLYSNSTISPNLNNYIRGIEQYFSFEVIVDYDEGTTYQRLYNNSDYEWTVTLRVRENNTIKENTGTIYPGSYLQGSGYSSTGEYWIKFTDNFVRIRPYQRSNVGGSSSFFNSSEYWDINWRDTGLSFSA